MTNEEIADKLEIYNKWRRGEPPYDSGACGLPIEPKELGLLIDTAVMILRMKTGDKNAPKKNKNSPIKTEMQGKMTNKTS